MATKWDDFEPVSATPSSVNWADFEPVDPKPTGGLVAAAKQAIGATIKGAGQAASDFIPGVSKANPVTTYGQSVVDANPTAIQSLGDIAESPWQATKEAVGNAAGSMVSMVGGALGAKALGGGLSAAAPFTGPAAPIVGGVGKLISTFGPGVAPVVTAALPSYSGIREEQIKADPANEADARSKAIAALGAGTVGAIETRFGPQEWALSAMKKGGIESIAKKFADAKSIPGAIGKGILHGGSVEGAEELVQNPIEQLASYQDPTTRQAIGETLFGGAMGAIGGGALGGGMAGVAKATNREQPSPQPVEAPVAVVPPPVTINPAAGPLQSATAKGMQSGAVQQTQQQAIARAAGIPATGGIASETAQEGQEGQEGQGAMGVAQAPAGATGEPVPASPVAAPTGLAGAAVGTGTLPGESADVVAQGDPFADAEFRQLATQESQDVDARRHGIAQRQSLLRDARLEEIDGRVATRRQRDERDARMAIIDALPLMRFQNPVAAFESELQRQGFNKSGATAGERYLIQRRVQAESALLQDYQPIVEPSLPNELALPERSPRAPSQTSASRVDSLVARAKSSPGARVKNGRLLNAHGKTLASGLTPAEVSALAPHIKSKGIASRGNETQVAIPPASGQQAQPAPAPTPAAGVAPTSPVADRRAEYLASRNFPSLKTPPQPTSGALPMEQQATPLTLPKGMSPKSVSGTSGKNGIPPGIPREKIRETPPAVVSQETPSGATQADLSLTGATQPTVAERKAELLAKRNALASAADRLSSAKPDTSAQATLVADASGRMQSAARKSVAERRAEFEAMRGRFVAGMEGRRQQAEAQHIEGKTVEPATADVVTQAVSKGARNSGLDLRQEQGELLKQIDEAIAKAPKAYDDAAGFVTFDVPGDGKFKVRNNAIRLSAFRKQITGAAAAGFRPEPKRAAHKTPMQKIEGGKASQQTIREMISEGDLTAALELSKVAGTPMVFGNYASPNRSHPIPYTDSKAFSPTGFGEIPMVSARSAEGSLWHVILTDSGLSLSSGNSRDAAEAKAYSVLKSKDVAQLREQIANTIKGKVKDQSALEAEWVKWAEQEEDAKDNAAERKAKRDAAKATEFAADRAKWEELTGEKPSIATFSPANPFASGQMTTTNVLDGYEKARKNGKGAEFIDYAESKLDSEVSGHKPVLDMLRSLRSTNAGQWRYRGNEAPGGLPRYERIVKTADGREIRATLDGDTSTYGFVREDDVIKARIGEVGSPTFQQAQKQADEVIDALMVPMKDRAVGTPDTVEPPDIPASVRDYVKHALGRLRDAEQALEGVERAIGKGHILALEVRDQQDAINASRARLDEFRALAKGKGIDADAIISEMGGEPDFARFGSHAENRSTESRTVRPDSLNLLRNPVENGDTIEFSNGEKWVAKEGWTGGPGAWTLLQGKIEHPTVRGIKGQSEFIRAIIDADERAKAKQTESEASQNDDLRGYAYAIVKDGRILTSGSFPTPKYMPNGDDAKLSKWVDEAKQRGADLYIGGYPGAAAWKPQDGLIFGMTFDEIQAKQLEKVVPPASIRHAMPKDAVMVFNGQNPESAQEKPETTPPGPSQANTEDAGAELTYNRRNRLTRGLKWDDIASKDEALRVKETTKAKVYPKPDYKAMIESGMRPQLAHIVKQVYDSIATSPQTRRGAVPTDDDIKSYIAGVNRVMDAVTKWAGDADRGGKWLLALVARGVRNRGSVIDFSVADNLEAQRSLVVAAFPNGYEPVRNELIAIGGNKVYGALQPGVRELNDAVKANNSGWPESQESWQRQGITVVNGDDVKAETSEASHGKQATIVRFTIPNGTFSRSLKVVTVEGTRDAESPEVRKAIDDGLAEYSGRFLLLSKVKSVVSTHATEDEAKDAARVLVSREGRKNTVSDNGISVTAAERFGEDRRGFLAQGAMDRANANAKKAADLFISKPSPSELASLLNIPFSTSFPGASDFMDAQGNEGSPYVAVVNAKFLGYLDQAEPIGVESLGRLNIPLQRLVLSSVIASVHDQKVRWRIVKLVPVDVVHDLSREKFPPYKLLSNPSVLWDALASNNNPSVSVPDRRLALRFVSSVASVIAKDVSSGAAWTLPHNGPAMSAIASTQGQRPDLLYVKRLGGQNVSSDELLNTFSFKAVNFGNWLKGKANEHERQLHLNHAYDSFMDLADVLGVPPEAMSLNGMLGVAIGAQGSGGFATAHFVPGVNEINLTRESGAGALAHEWGHALDYYFARQAGLTRATDPFLTVHLKTAEGAEIRPEILDKFKAIVQAMHRRPITPEEAAAQRQEKIASARRNLDGWLNSIVSTDKREDADIMRAVDRIKSGDLGDGAVAVSRRSSVKPAIAEFGKVIKEKTGRSLDRTDMSAIDSWANSLKYLQSQSDEDATHVPQQMVETNYSKDAASLDKEKGGKRYWSTSLEMFARAFDAFISDTLEAKAAKNTYLSHAGRDGKTVPTGTERTTINKAIQGLVDAIETKPGENGNVVLFNADTDAIAGSTADRAIYDMAQESRPAADILSFIGKASRRPFNRYLANALRNLGVAPAVTLDAQGGWKFNQGKPGAKYAAAYNPKTDTIALFTPRDAERHVLHEFVHSATLKAIAKGGPASMRMRALFAHVQKSGALAGQYGMSNLDEFVAEAFTNPKFQDALKAIPAPAGSKLQNAWRWFVQAVSRILGMQTAAQETALDRALTLGGGLMRENAALAGGTESTRFSQQSALPDIRFNIATDWISNPAVTDFVANAMRSDKSTSIITPFNTQYHKAEKWAAEGKPLFKRVFELGQKFLSDTSRFAVMAQDAAPTLFHEIKSVADAKDSLRSIKSFGDLTGATHRKDIDAIASPLYEGTLYGGGSPTNGIVFSDAMLRDKYKLTDRQIRLYREALSAVNVSLDEMAKSVIAKHAKNSEVAFDSELEVDEMADAVIESIEERKADLEYSVGDEMQEETNAEAENYRDMDMNEEAAKVLAQFERNKKDVAKTIARLNKTIEDIRGVVAKNANLQEHGYFPLMRFGKNTVTAKDEKGNTAYFGMFEGIPLVPRSGQYEANKVAAAIRAEHPEWTVTTGIHNTEKYKLYEGMNLEAVQLFADHMDKDSLEPFQEFLRMATGDRSVMKRLIHRQGTPGFDRDVRRTLAQFIVSNARHTSSAYNLFEMRKAAERADTDGGDIGEEAAKLYKYIAEPQEEAHKLRGFLFFNFLGGSIASALVNLSQVPMMTFPYLTQYESSGKLANRLRLAAAMAIANPGKIPGKLGSALMRAEQDGITAPQEIHQLTATASNSIFAGNPAATGLLRFWGMPFAMAESFNRRVTFISAYQIAEGMTREQLAATGTKTAFEFAERAVTDTQGIYNKGNRMNVGRGALGATMMTFKQFSIMYLELLKRLPRKQQLMMLGIMALAAGAGGLPFVEDIEDIIDTFGQWLGFGTNSKRWVRNALSGATSPQVADVLLNGVASQMGVDLHSRFGMQNLIPGSGALKQSSVDKGRDAAEFFGPAASILQSAATALQEMATGHAGRAAKAMAPLALQNIAKGYEMAATGYAEDSKDRRTIPVTPIEAAVKTVGFNPKSIADFGTIKRDIAQDQRMLQVKREEFTSAIADAILSGDVEGRKEAMMEMAQWNKDNPALRVTIAPGAIARRLKEARTEGATRFLKSLPKTMRADARQELVQ